MAEIPTGDWSWINSAAERFERAWKEGPRPGIEDYLNEVEEPQRPRLLDELLRLEIELRRNVGEQPTSDEYHDRFPAHPTVVAEVFRGGKKSSSAAVGVESNGSDPV